MQAVNTVETYRDFLVGSKAGDTLTLTRTQGGAVKILGQKSLVEAHGGSVACNRETLKLFREALSQQYGVFGEHAFDMALGTRLSEGESLRNCDIQNVLDILDNTKVSASRAKMIESRFIGELMRQAESHPEVLKYGAEAEVRKGVLDLYNSEGYAKVRQMMLSMTSQKELSLWVSSMIEDQLSKIKVEKSNLSGIAPGADGNVQGKKDDQDEIVGLRNLSTQFEAGETSVEDRIKAGVLSSGMRVNSAGERLVLERLKTNGVEPGFIAHSDWSAEQTREMMDKPGSVLATAAENVLKNNLKKSWNDPQELRALKSKYFVEIRDAILENRKDYKDMKGTSASRLSKRFIVKLDYNEGDSVGKASGSYGKLRLPSRVKTDKGSLYHHFRVTTADNASVGAVREALANDLTRALGIPAQELEIVRGKYFDGRTKLMLKAGFAEGYKDFDGNFLNDGRVVLPGSKKTEDLGRYKAAFLLLADRDAVGSHGQNKGMRNGKFFAIDPGHSLEGNGKYLEVSDDFSFEDTKRMSLGKRFSNFSVFDDSNRSEKLRGWRTILNNHQKLAAVFESYGTAFADTGDDDPDKALKAKIRDELKTMADEFETSFRKMKAVFEQQVETHREISDRLGEGIADKVIDAVENFERATSPVKSQSKHGKVQLTHLEVVPKTRVKWSASFDAASGSVRFSSSVPLGKAQSQKLNAFLEKAGYTTRKDGDGKVSVNVDLKEINNFLEYFTEEKVKGL